MHVQAWFEEIKLQQLKEPFHFAEGEDLVKLYDDCQNRPDDFKEMCKDCGLKSYDIFHLRSALKKLLR